MEIKLDGQSLLLVPENETDAFKLGKLSEKIYCKEVFLEKQFRYLSIIGDNVINILFEAYCLKQQKTHEPD